MPVRLHWFLPTNGDSHTDLSLGNAVGAHGARIDDAATNARKGDLAYMSQVARAAESLGFEAALTPTSSWCEEAWVITAALTQLTRDFKYLVAFRPGLQSPTLAAQAAATYQRVSGDRLLLNVVVGGDAIEQRRYGDTIGKDSRYARADEFLAIVRELWTGEEVNFSGEWFEIEGARLLDPPAWPTVYLGGSSAAAVEVAARRADVFLTWGEPPEAVAAKLDTVREAADREGRELGFGIRLHAISRDTPEEAWAVADRMLAGLSEEKIADAQSIQQVSESEGQRRMTELHGGRTDQLEVSPNLWAGIGLVRGGAGTALVGSHEEVSERISEYADLGIDHFILSGYPHLEEAWQFAEGVVPTLARRGLISAREGADGGSMGVPFAASS
jgi:alkanesulfonate monooxygenase